MNPWELLCMTLIKHLAEFKEDAAFYASTTKGDLKWDDFESRVSLIVFVKILEFCQGQKQSYRPGK